MKRVIILLLAAILCLLFTGAAFADNVPDLNTDYTACMIYAAVNGDISAGQALEPLRNAKIDILGVEDTYKKFTFEELYLLSKIIYTEAGSSWISDDWKLAVGEVVLNRVASPEFPDTVAGVIYQRGQYGGVNGSYFAKLRPPERCVELAVRLLNGERNMVPSVVFQAEFRQGSGVYKAYYDRYLGWAYFCYSSRRYLYE